MRRTRWSVEIKAAFVKKVMHSVDAGQIEAFSQFRLWQPVPFSAPFAFMGARTV